MAYELIVIWDDGQKEIVEYPTEEKAREIEDGMKMAFGNQIQWMGIREKRC